MKDKSSVVVEEYLQMIYALMDGTMPIKSIDLVKHMKSSPSTVHATLSRMQRDELVKVNRKKEISLTPNGIKKAKALAKRHRLVETFLCDTLGISWHEVHQHAHQLEHGLSPLVEKKLTEFLNHPTNCPHGTPITGSKEQLFRDTLALKEFNRDDTVEIVLVHEMLEESVDLMAYLQEKRIQPGERHRIAEKTDITQTLVLASDPPSHRPQRIQPTF
jgi:DtxR family transcriptional regulator, Mn-dependent transcriptional regulator